MMIKKKEKNMKEKKKKRPAKIEKSGSLFSLYFIKKIQRKIKEYNKDNQQQ